MRTLAILGLGLMGGSLGLAARRSGVVSRVQAYARRGESRAKAITLNVVDSAFETPAEAVAEADIVVVCVPVLQIPALVEQCATSLKSGAVITDVGSTKHEVVESIESLLHGSGAEFVGSHPMAGSEQTGIGAANADLYQDATVIVTPTTRSGIDAVATIQEFWAALGAQVETMSPQAHDGLIARTSHLPHLVAAALVDTVLGKSPEASGLCANGFRDTTRVAAGSEEIWHDIVKTNPACVSEALGDMITSLQDIRGLVDRGEFDHIRDYLESCRRIRQSLGDQV
jgi:prephenate dehydrogenase